MSCLSANLTCLNGGSCTGNSCICLNECFFGNRCEYYFNLFELSMTSAILQDTLYAKIGYVIAFAALATIGLVNNILALITFMREPIRITACGTYLIIYCSFNIVLMLLIYTDIISFFDYNKDTYRQWDCFYLPYFCLTFDYIYIWMSVAIIIEKLLMQCLNFPMFGSRLRAVIISFLIIIVIALSNIPEIKVRNLSQTLTNQTVCSYNVLNSHAWYRAQYILSYSHIIIPCVAHVIAMISILTTIVRRKIYIRGYTRSVKLYRVWLEQLYINRDFFISPLAIIIFILPHAIIHFILLPQCVKDNGMVQVRLHSSVVLLLHVPAALPFAIYVYPNRIYFKEFTKTNVYRKLCCYSRRQKEYIHKLIAHPWTITGNGRNKT
ncbi:unnamed protein product [Rotaria magnacalcarata]|uniref:G-protein coupled receptors family 1 profile domain-containing protein n=1 Tax=Rotaria magnacalcarata TaxID=392030 RepID=A0A816XKS1_9BILA|nr:unnamed protein product [Rotaria magnacalcarata]CAF3874211.1 unnamed protein product [Rotaria magnacalcarata]